MVERQPEKLKVVGSNPILNKMLFLYFYIITIIAFKFSLTILIFLNIVLYILYNIRLFKPSNIYKLYQSGKIFSKMFPQTNIIINQEIIG